ncbi:MAG: site-specific integrase [Prevotella sp.]|nr:site-specific integrase [Prevotella sp.]
MFTTAIVYDRKRQSEGGKDGTLELRITYNRKSYYINTGMRIKAKHWAGAIVGRPDADALNNRLRIIVARVNEKINEFIEKREPIDVNVIKEHIFAGTKVDGKQNRMLEWIAQQIPMLNVSEGTRRHYKLLLDRLKQYDKMQAWSDLSVEAIYEWDAWLHNLTNVNAKQTEGKAPVTIGEGAIYNYHKYLKFMLNRAVDFGIIGMSPYSRLKGRFTKPSYDNIEYLTEDEMKVIINLHPTPGTNVAAARDLFVFQMFTGLSYSDTQAFDISQYKKVDGQWVHTGQRIKTGVPYVSVLLPPVIDVLERNNWQVPKINIDTYNYSLKTIGKVLGMERLHSHLARHTFATYMLSNDVKVQNVMRMLGHKNIRQTMKYAKVLAKDVQADFNMIAEKLK